MKETLRFKKKFKIKDLNKKTHNENYRDTFDNGFAYYVHEREKTIDLGLYQDQIMLNRNKHFFSNW